jgi:peroxiredoxin family protein
LVNRLKQAFQRRFAVIACPVAIDVASIKDSNQFVEWVSAPLRGFAPSPPLP